MGNDKMIVTIISPGSAGKLVKSRFSNADEAWWFIHALVSKDVRIVTDLHKTLDTTDKDVPLGAPAIIVSFVGSSGKTFDEAEADSRARIKSGQAVFALLVHRRGKSYALTNEPGSKAWAVDIVHKALQSQQSLADGGASASAAAADVDLHFFDDAADHVDSVEKYTGAFAHLFDPEGGIPFDQFTKSKAKLTDPK